MHKDVPALERINKSGYPLQFAVEHHVNNAVTRNGWSIGYTEHGWVNGHQHGFIDLVLRDTRSSTLVVECKRTKAATWLFMGPKGHAKPRRHAKAFVSSWDGRAMKGWDDIPISPECPETLFCMVHQGQNNEQNLQKLMLEPIGAELILATEALAKEEKSFNRQQKKLTDRFYFNVLVTTAELKVARFDPGKIKLRDGMLADAAFDIFPYVRFRKQMAVRERLFTREDFENSVDPAEAKENTLFVVNAESLLDFLNAFEVPPMSRILQVSLGRRNDNAL